MRARFWSALLVASTVIAAVIVANCSPHLPPTTVAPSPDPELASFTQALQAYVNATQPYRKEAAQQGQNVPGQAQPSPNAAAAVRTRQNSLAEALQTKIRPNATQGQLFVGASAAEIKRAVADLYASPKRTLVEDEVEEQNEGPRDSASSIGVNKHVVAPRVPPLVLQVLPPIPKQLEYAFLDRTLLLRDVDADLVVDYLPDALPAQPAAPKVAAAAAPSSRAASYLALPEVRGGTNFALIGDSGSGDDAQNAVAQAMVNYFNTARHFRYVLMLGDNLYHDDYNREFLEPYKPLLDRGVTFYAALGNHDRDLEQHFKPFNMGDRDHYSFDQGNARFAVLNTNHPADPAQLEWLDTVFTDAGTKWRIAFFHHPLYSSGPHEQESRDVIRPALEAALVKNKVNVVFSGHEHLYERVAPQKGIRYFVAGGGGRNLYEVERSPFDEVAVSAHHFMAINIAGDALYYEALTPDGRTLDCGVDWRTADARGKGPDQTGQAWLAACRSALHPTTDRQDNSARPE